MPRIGYGFRPPDPQRSARAMGYELRISPKHAYELCKWLRYRSLGQAKQLLEKLVAMEIPAPFTRYDSGLGHRSQLKGAGRYPIKAAKQLLKLLRDAEANAKSQGLEPGELKLYLAAHRGRTLKGWIPRAYGRSTPWNQQTVNLELVLFKE